MKQTAEEFFRNKLKELHPNKEVISLSYEMISAEQGLRWAHEFKQLHLQNVSGSLQDRLFELANDFAVAKQGEVAVKLHSIHNGLQYEAQQETAQGFNLTDEDRLKRSDKLWKKLVKELSVLQDDNFTARQLFDYIERHYCQPPQQPTIGYKYAKQQSNPR